MQVYSSLYKIESFILSNHTSSEIDVFLKDSSIEVSLVDFWKETELVSFQANAFSLYRFLVWIKDNYTVHLF